MYFLAERGERRPDGRQQLLAYAVGCNPDTDPFDDWWHLAGRELGGDDFAEYFDPKDGLFTRLLHSADDLVQSATATHLSWPWCLPPEAATAAQPRSPAPGLLFAPRPSPRMRVRLQPPRHAPPATAPACHRRRPHARPVQGQSAHLHHRGTHQRLPALARAAGQRRPPCRHGGLASPTPARKWKQPCASCATAEHWQVPIHWLEYLPTEPGFALVDFDQASRQGGPFEALIRKRQYLPNPSLAAARPA